MLTPRFGELFDQLVAACVRYHEASRHVDDVTELAMRRFDLEKIRLAITDERMFIEASSVTPQDHEWLDEIGVRIG